MLYSNFMLKRSLNFLGCSSYQVLEFIGSISSPNPISTEISSNINTKMEASKSINTVAQATLNSSDTSQSSLNSNTLEKMKQSGSNNPVAPATSNVFFSDTVFHGTCVVCGPLLPCPNPIAVVLGQTVFNQELVTMLDALQIRDAHFLGTKMCGPGEKVLYSTTPPSWFFKNRIGNTYYNEYENKFAHSDFFGVADMPCRCFLQQPNMWQLKLNYERKPYSIYMDDNLLIVNRMVEDHEVHFYFVLDQYEEIETMYTLCDTFIDFWVCYCSFRDGLKNPMVAQMNTECEKTSRINCSHVKSDHDDKFFEMLDKLPYKEVTFLVESKRLFYESKIDVRLPTGQYQRQKKWALNKIKKLEEYLEYRKAFNTDFHQTTEHRTPRFLKKFKPIDFEISFVNYTNEERHFPSNVKVTKIGERKVESKIIANDQYNTFLKNKRNNKPNKGTGDYNKPQKSNPIQYTFLEQIRTTDEYFKASSKNREIMEKNKDLIFKKGILVKNWYREIKHLMVEDEITKIEFDTNDHEFDEFLDDKWCDEEILDNKREEQPYFSYLKDEVQKEIQDKKVAQMFSTVSSVSNLIKTVEETDLINRASEVVNKVDAVSNSLNDVLHGVEDSNIVTKASGALEKFESASTSLTRLTNQASGHLGALKVETLKVMQNASELIKAMSDKIGNANFPIEPILLELTTLTCRFKDNYSMIVSYARMFFNIANTLVHHFTGASLSILSAAFQIKQKVTQMSFEDLFAWLPEPLKINIRSLSSFNTIVNAFKNTVYLGSTIKNAFLDLMGHILPSLFGATDYYKTDEYAQTMKYIIDLKSNATFADTNAVAEALPELKTHMDRLSAWSLEASKSWFPSHYTIALKNAYKDLQDVYRRVNAKISHEKPRMRPVGIMIKGPTSIGKSTLVTVIGRFLAALYEKEFSYYSRSSGSQFWDGYKGQFLVSYDDIGQVTTFDEIPEIFAVISTNPFLPPLATLDNENIGVKGTFFSSDVVIATSNIADFQVLNNKIHDVDAFMSRFPISIEMLWRQNNNGPPESDYSHATFNLTLPSSTKNGLNAIDMFKELKAFVVDYVKQNKEIYKTGGGLSNFLENVFVQTGTQKPQTGELGTNESSLVDQNMIVNNEEFHDASDCDKRKMPNIGWTPRGVSVPRYAFQLLKADFNRIYQAAANTVYRRGYTALCHMGEVCNVLFRKAISFTLTNLSYIANALIAIKMVLHIYYERRQHTEFKKALCTLLETSESDDPMNILGVILDSVCKGCREKVLQILNNHGIAAQQQAESYVPRKPRKPRTEFNCEVHNVLEEQEDSFLGNKVKLIAEHPIPTVRNLAEGFVDSKANSIKDYLANNMVILSNDITHVQAIPLTGHILLTVSHFFNYLTAKKLKTFNYHDGVSNVSISMESVRITLLKDDLAFVELPKAFQPFPDIRNKFMSEDEFKLAIKDEDTILTLVYLTDKTAMNSEVVQFGNFQIRNDVAYECPMTGKEYALSRSMAYNVNSQPGWCGAPIFVNNNRTNGKIFGIHTWGVCKTPYGGCTIITKEMINSFFKPTTQCYYSLPSTKEKIFDDIQMLRQDLKPTRVPKTKLEPTDFLFDVPQFKIPSKQNTTVLLEQFNLKFSRQRHSFDPKYLELAKKHVRKLLFQNTNVQYLDVRSTYEECMGNYENLTGISMTTSAGFPWVAQGIKRSDLLDNTDGKYTILSDQLRQTLEYREKCYRAGCVPFAVWSTCTKDELLKPGKDTRLFEIGPIDQVIYGRRLFSTFMDFFHSIHNKSFSAVGMNPESFQWDEMVLNLLSINRRGLFTDWKKYDCTLPNQIIFAVCEIINDWYDKFVSDGLNKQRELFFYEGMYRVIKVLHYLFKTQIGIGSGWILTTIVNTIANCLIHFIIYLHLSPVHLRSLTILQQNSYFLFYGDDSVVTVKDEILEFFNTITIAQSAKELFNMEMQLDKKGSELIPYQNVMSLTFLKRSISENRINGKFVPILDLKSMYAMISYYYKSKVISRTESHQAIIDSFMQFAYFYGEEFFDLFKQYFESRKFFCHEFSYYHDIFTNFNTFEFLQI